MGQSLSRRTYQRQIPIFICSLFIAVLFANFVIDWDPLEVVRGGFLTTANLVTVLVWSFAIVTLLINSARHIVQTQLEMRVRAEGAIIVATTAFFLLLIVSTPDYEKGELYSHIHIAIMGRIMLGMEGLTLTHFVYNMWKRITSSPMTAEMLFFNFVFIFMIFRKMSLFGFYLPFTMDVGDWIEKVLYASLMRGLTLITSVGTTIVLLRALIGKEPGMIELEV